jgi:hypothetical protein
MSPILNNGNDGSAGWDGSDSYNANLAAQGWHAVGGESEQAPEIDSIMNHLIFLDYGGEGTGGGTNDDVWAATHSAPVHDHGCAGYYETYDGSSNFWGWGTIGHSLLDCKAHGVKEIGIMVGTWMINHSSAQDYITLAQNMESNGITCAGIGVWGGYGNNANNVYNTFASWYKQWQAIWPPETRTMKERYTPGPGPAPPAPTTLTFASAPTACSQGVGSLDVFVEGSDGALWHGYPTTTTWKWETLFGTITSAPAATYRANGLDVVARGSDGALWYRHMPAPPPFAWDPWISLGGAILKGTGPTITSRDADSLDVFVIGTDSALYRKSLSGSVWSAWVKEATKA